MLEKLETAWRRSHQVGRVGISLMLWLEWWKPFGIAEKAAKLNFRIHVSAAKTQHHPHGL